MIEMVYCLPIATTFPGMDCVCLRIAKNRRTPNIPVTGTSGVSLSDGVVVSQGNCYCPHEAAS